VILLPYGLDAILVELDDPRQVEACRLAACALPAVVEVVPGARTVLVRTAPADLAAASSALAALDLATLAQALPAAAGPQIEIGVRYDGADLPTVASRLGISVGELIAMHSEPGYVVRFCGFAPGFAYLDGLDPRLHLPRRSEPRTSVPAGAVAIAGEFTAVYPRASPGGWHLLGHTDAVVWDSERDPPALLAPGTRVRFVPR
jgi:KipI family sensor histidine kinase inhibitor